jgi:hypothetical protein
MQRTFVGLILLIVSIINIQAQDEYKPIKWFIRPSFGSTIALNPKTFGFITDHLTTYTNQNIYWQISAGFFSNNWGLEFYYMRNNNNQLKNRFNEFSDEVANRYGDKYYMNISSGSYYYDFENSSELIMERGSIGPIYRIVKNKAIYIFRGQIGVISFSTDWGSVYLKEMGTNSIIDVHWSADRVVKDFMTINPSFTFGYRIAKRIVLDLDINYWFYNLDFNYQESSTNFITGQTDITTYRYKRIANDLSFGVGFMVVLTQQHN